MTRSQIGFPAQARNSNHAADSQGRPCGRFNAEVFLGIGLAVIVGADNDRVAG